MLFGNFDIIKNNYYLIFKILNILIFNVILNILNKINNLIKINFSRMFKNLLLEEDSDDSFSAGQEDLDI